MPKTDPETFAASNNNLNKLRAAVLGANDGIVSTAGLVLGVSGALASKETVLVAGFAGLVAGALSMAAGEFVSVSSQRDSEKSLINRRQIHIATSHASNNSEELMKVYTEKGLSNATAAKVIEELAALKRIDSELEKEMGVDTNDISSPWAAAFASASAFIAGSLIPLAAIFMSPDDLRIPITATAVLISLILTGTISARVGQANKTRAALRVVIWGIGAMAITYAIGLLLGVSID